MRFRVVAGVLTALLANPSAVAVASAGLPLPDDPISQDDTERSENETNPQGAGPSGPGGYWTGLKVRPRRPRQDSNVRVLVHCPHTSTDAIVTAKPFNPPGSFRHSTPLGVGIRKGRGFDTKYVAYDALLGWRLVRLKCLRITMLEHPRRRIVRLVSRDRTYVLIRPFRKERF
ncbi:hypothetical protein ACIBIZ_40930 [Nonomuraea spiralis]|uniref:hypothetical protein n=1 Tax=Nonomuraea TaxID=83681 RepID=UPI000F790B64|nr:hypothetical protein [Nonomuraea sp. WAC 01424]